MLFFLKSSEDKSVFSEPTYLDSGRVFDHAESWNLIFTVFTGEIVISPIMFETWQSKKFMLLENITDRLIQQFRHNRWLSLGMEWKLKWDYKLGIKYIQRPDARKNTKNCFKGHYWAHLKVCFFKLFTVIWWLFYNCILWV